MQDQGPLVDRLFRVLAPVTVVRRGITTELYVRTIGGKDEAARNDYAVSRSRKLYNALRDPDSEAYQQYLTVLDDTPRDELVEHALRLKLPQLAREARQAAVRTRDPEPPDNPTLTEIIETDIETEHLDAEVERERSGQLDVLVKAYREELLGLSDILLLEEVRALYIDATLNQVYGAVSNAYTLYAAVFVDDQCKMRYFRHPSEVEEADADFVAQLVARYIELDAFSQEPEHLKN